MQQHSRKSRLVVTDELPLSSFVHSSVIALNPISTDEAARVVNDALYENSREVDVFQCVRDFWITDALNDTRLFGMGFDSQSDKSLLLSSGDSLLIVHY